MTEDRLLALVVLASALLIVGAAASGFGRAAWRDFRSRGRAFRDTRVYAVPSVYDDPRVAWSQIPSWGGLRWPSGWIGRPDMGELLDAIEFEWPARRDRREPPAVFDHQGIR